MSEQDCCCFPRREKNLEPNEKSLTFKSGTINDSLFNLQAINKQKIKNQQNIPVFPFYQQLKRKYQRNPQLKPFEDTLFAPNKSSIGNLDINKKVKIVWRRIGQVIKNPSFFEGLIEPKDIRQGSTGDCYYLSVVAALAEQRINIELLFPKGQKINPNGFYSASFFIRGQRTQVTVDDYFPMTNKNQFVFAKPVKEEIWVMVLEKCWAKLHKSYANIDGGYINYAFRAFTAAPVKTYIIPNYNPLKLWNLVVKDQKAKAVFCGATPKKSSQQKIINAVSSVGIVESHAYTVLGFYTVNAEKIVKIRNPWGDIQWKGRASDKDSFWQRVSQEDKNKIGFQEENDGIFFMFWEDFIKQFIEIDACLFDVSSKSNFITISFSNSKTQFFLINLQRDGYLSMTMSKFQQNEGRMTMILAKMDLKTKEIVYIDSSSFKEFKDQVLKIPKISAGLYLLFTQGTGFQEKQYDLTVGFYSDQLFKIQKVQINAINFLYSLFLDRALTVFQSSDPSNVIFNNAYAFNELFSGHCRYGYCAIINYNDYTISATFTTKSFQKEQLILQKIYKDTEQFQIIVRPETLKIFFYRIKVHSTKSVINLPRPTLKKVKYN